jgi:competence protein ComFB
MEERSLFDCDLTGIGNINEEIVIELMEIVLNEDKNICRCQLCIEDIYALSLNQLPPRYVQSTFKDRTLHDVNLTSRIDRTQIEKAVREAIGKVRKNPYH